MLAKGNPRKHDPIGLRDITRIAQAKNGPTDCSGGPVSRSILKRH